MFHHVGSSSYYIYSSFFVCTSVHEEIKSYLTVCVVYVCIYVSMYVCMYVCMYMCMMFVCVCMYACMYVCMYVQTYNASAITLSVHKR